MHTEQSITAKLARIKRPAGMPDDVWEKFMTRQRELLESEPERPWTAEEVRANTEKILDDWDRRFGKPEGDR